MYLKLIMIWIAFLIPTIIARFLAETNSTQCYGVIFDAGSSGTRVYVYNWDCRTTPGLPFINISQAAPQDKIIPGLSTFATNLTGIPNYLSPLIQFAYNNVPKSMYQYTPIMLGATAGLRLLDPQAEHQIINEVQVVFSQTQFLYNQSWVQVISGQQEGAYLWMSVYYMLWGYVTNLATVDLGGASTQIAIPAPNTTQDVVVINIPNNVTNYDLYAVSYLGYGNDMARTSVTAYSINGSGAIYSPCYHSGYAGEFQQNNQTYALIGTGNFALCSSYILQYLNVSNNGSINGHYQPQVTNQTVYAVSGVATMANFFGIPNFTLTQYYAYSYNFCSLTYQQAQAQYGDSPYLATNYFMSVYVYELLAAGYGIPQNMTIYAPLEIDGLTPTWTLAAMSYNLAQMNCDEDSPLCQAGGLLYAILLLLLLVN